MFNSKLLAIPAVLLAVASVLYFTRHQEQDLAALLPPRFEHSSIEAAQVAAASSAAQHGASFTGVLGTGSMRPYFPVAPAGADPRATVVGYVVANPSIKYADLRRGMLAVYNPEGRPGETWLHQLVQKDEYGWILSGSANPRSESWWRVTEKNFRFVVLEAHTTLLPANRR